MIRAPKRSERCSGRNEYLPRPHEMTGKLVSSIIAPTDLFVHHTRCSIFDPTSAY